MKDLFNYTEIRERKNSCLHIMGLCRGGPDLKKMKRLGWRLL